ncbi:MAG: tetratricopeptide repeat protein [Bacteroidia bacterium]
MNQNRFYYLLFTGIILFTQPIFAQPVNPSLDQGILYYQSNRFADAIREFDRAKKIEPENPVIYEYIANTYYKMQAYESAENYYTDAINKYYQILKNSRQADIYRDGGLVLLEPGSSSRTSYAMLYNNRGVTRVKLNKSWEAARDFDEALNIDPGLTIAKDNLNFAKTGQATTASVPRGDNYNRAGGPNYTYSRPISVPQPVDPSSKKEQSVDVREERLAAIDEGRTSVFDIFKPKPFEKRNVPSRGKVYKLPTVGARSHNYLTIESVHIMPNATLITIKVLNEERKPFDVSIADRNSDEAFFITDRSGAKRTTYKMKNATGINFYPRTTELKPGESLVFTLEFPKIPDDMGFINLIEGNNQIGQEWNFYNIDLTK